MDVFRLAKRQGAFFRVVDCPAARSSRVSTAPVAKPACGGGFGETYSPIPVKWISARNSRGRPVRSAFQCLCGRGRRGRAIRRGPFRGTRLSGGDATIYRHAIADGTVDYFNDKGHGAKRALMRTPIDGARLSSGFGNRRHPILGYDKMHRGVDFAAPSGTPVYAAGDGVVERAGPWSGYGNYIRIRHNDGYSTAYAHLRNYAKGIHKGKRVRQGRIIGYVGATGLSTGPHLHYEI